MMRSTPTIRSSFNGARTDAPQTRKIKNNNLPTELKYQNIEQHETKTLARKRKHRSKLHNLMRAGKSPSKGCVCNPMTAKFE